MPPLESNLGSNSNDNAKDERNSNRFTIKDQHFQKSNVKDDIRNGVSMDDLDKDQRNILANILHEGGVDSGVIRAHCFPPGWSVPQPPGWSVSQPPEDNVATNLRKNRFVPAEAMEAYNTYAQSRMWSALPVSGPSTRGTQEPKGNIQFFLSDKPTTREKLPRMGAAARTPMQPNRPEMIMERQRRSHIDR
jgi:hypothetical protein